MVVASRLAFDPAWWTVGSFDCLHEAVRCLVLCRGSKACCAETVGHTLRVLGWYRKGYSSPTFERWSRWVQWPWSAAPVTNSFIC